MLPFKKKNPQEIKKCDKLIIMHGFLELQYNCTQGINGKERLHPAHDM